MKRKGKEQGQSPGPPDLESFFAEVAEKYHGQTGAAVVVTVLEPGVSEISVEIGDLDPRQILQEISMGIRSLVDYYTYEDDEVLREEG